MTEIASVNEFITESLLQSTLDMVDANNGDLRSVSAIVRSIRLVKRIDAENALELCKQMLAITRRRAGR